MIVYIMSRTIQYAIIPLSGLGIFILLALLFDAHALRFIAVRTGFGVEQEKAGILSALKSYNRILSDFYASDGTPALIGDFPAATPLKHELFRDIGFLRQNKRVLVYDHASSAAVEIDLRTPYTADAIVYEEWNYLYQQIDSRQPLENPKGMGQGFRYRLLRRGGRWIVVAWDPVDVAVPEEKDKHYF